MTPGRAFVPTCFYGGEQHVAERKREERNPLSCQVVKQVRGHTCAAGSNTIQVNVLMKLFSLLFNENLKKKKINQYSQCR